MYFVNVTRLKRHLTWILRLLLYHNKLLNSTCTWLIPFYFFWKEKGAEWEWLQREEAVQLPTHCYTQLCNEQQEEKNNTRVGLKYVVQVISPVTIINTNTTAYPFSLNLSQNADSM